MVRAASTRKEKYNAKLRGSVINARITALSDMMKEQVDQQFSIQFFYETKAKKYCEAQGMYGLEMHHYINFCMRLWALSRTFTQATLRNEAEQEAAKWMRRGLNAAHLVELAKVFGIDLTGWP